MNRISEADLERIRELIKQPVTDPLLAIEWAKRAKVDLEALVDDATDRLKAHGGEFAQLVRAAVEAKILATVNGRAVLTSRTKELSLNVAVTSLGVFVDVRLEIGVGA
jgi:hypothetical protein